MAHTVGMAKSTIEPSYRSGSNRVVVGDSFIYEINLYKIYKDRAETIGSQFYSSPKPLQFKECKTVKNKDYILMKTMTWVAAPLDYLESNNFTLDSGERKQSKRNNSGGNKTRRR